MEHTQVWHGSRDATLLKSSSNPDCCKATIWTRCINYKVAIWNNCQFLQAIQFSFWGDNAILYLNFRPVSCHWRGDVFVPFIIFTITFSQFYAVVVETIIHHLTHQWFTAKFVAAFGYRTFKVVQVSKTMWVDKTFRVGQVISVVQLTNSFVLFKVDAVTLFVRCTFINTLEAFWSWQRFYHVTLKFEIGLRIGSTTLVSGIDTYPWKQQHGYHWHQHRESSDHVVWKLIRS